ncbi:MAG: hypothetical protein K2W82_04865 [Candidatus Obscuribacterales bacterium]|nr:hypothetical protein [Candidatus Obscuribacterales bacterium]
MKAIIFIWLLLMTTFPASAELPDLGPAVGTIALVDGDGSTVVIYRTPQVWENLKSGQTPSWYNPKLSVIESDAKVRVTKQSSLDDATWFLSQILVLTGKHRGETWWIHSRSLKAVQSRK